MDTQKAPAMDTGIQQDLPQTAVSDPLAGDGSWIIWPAENDFSTMGRDRGTSDVMGPGGSPRETASLPTRRVKTPSR